MNNILKIPVILLCMALATACSDNLDLRPIDKITADELFSNPAGTQLYLADLYNRLPMEDLTYFPREGFNFNNGGPNNGGFSTVMMTKMAVHSERNTFFSGSMLNWWDPAFALIRDVNLFIELIPDLDISQDQKDIYLGEASFIRGFAYFGLVKRYGGVPIITEAQVFDGDVEALQVTRSTEKETWDFVLAECDVAINTLGTDVNGRRASKWAAYALKSRAALFAASIAKFGVDTDLSGDAVDLGLVGISSSHANDYYQACINASAAIMAEDSPYSLYKPNPADPQEAAENYRAMFENPNIAMNEAILIKGRTIPGNSYGNNYDIWFNPAQLRNGWPHPGRMNPTLDFVDIFERYDNPGVSAPVVTTTDGDIDDYTGYSPSKNYLHFEDPTDLFEGKDARLMATVILPFSEFKDTQIIIQAGFVKPDGQARYLTKDQIEVNGVTYYTYGSAEPDGHSGFDPHGGNNTKTGFGFKKFLSTNPVVPGWNRSFTDYMEFRYAEILLNYAEAVAESGLGDMDMAQAALNAIRKRAAHQVEIPLTVDNVLRERIVELSFENKRLWDLIRRRTYHTEFNNASRHALMPLLDLRGTAPFKFIFVRQTLNNSPLTFEPKYYYRSIPGIGLNGLVQNPGY
jgi:hypothetical protein